MLSFYGGFSTLFPLTISEMDLSWQIQHQRPYKKTQAESRLSSKKADAERHSHLLKAIQRDPK